jgi:hypothetical protein
MGARLARLLIEASRRYEAMTPAERQAMHEAQRESWVRGEMEMLRHEREMTRLARERAARAEGTKP